MISYRESPDIEYNGTENCAVMKLFTDTAAELTGVTHFDGILLLHGSSAYVIETGDTYMLNGAGAWILQPSQNAFSNVYTKSEADNLFEWITVTITTDTLPLSFISDGAPPTSVTIKGNGQQTGTPSPQNILPFDGTGERTGNLFDYKTAYSAYLNAEDDVAAGSLGAVRNSLADFVGKTVTISVYCKTVTATRTFAQAVIGGVVVNSNSIYRNNTGYMTLTVTPESEDDYWIISYESLGTGNNIYSDLMLNTGSTALDYEPYGYKIPLTCAGQTTPLYLGEVSTVRRIKKLVLTSTTINWTYDSTYNRYSFAIADSLIVGVRLTPVACSHFVPISDGRSIGDVPNNAIYSNSQQTPNNWFIKTTDYTTASSFKQFLDDELAAGTPVTVWYVLASPTEGIVNEPLYKIGTYCDTLTTDTPIPTAKGSNTLTVDTTVQPSEMTITGKIRET